MQYASAPWLPNVLYDREPPASTTSATPMATHDRTSCPTLCFLLTPNTSMYSAGGGPGPASASAPAIPGVPTRLGGAGRPKERTRVCSAAEQNCSAFSATPTAPGSATRRLPQPPRLAPRRRQF